MKDIYKITIVCACLLFAFGCEEDRLEPRPLSFFSPENVLVDQAGFESVLVSLRKGLRWEYDGNQCGIVSQLITTDIGFATARNPFAPRNLPVQFTPNDDWNYDMLSYFDQSYGQIRTANGIIQALENVDLGDEAENQILAACYFYRSYWYYTLVHIFGDVPFISQQVEEAKLDFFTHARKTILDKIEDDMGFAVQWLPEENVEGAETVWAGLHLLTKIHLANSNFTDAVQTATQVIDGPFALVTERFGVDAGDPTRNLIWDLARPQNVFDGANTETILGFVDRFDALDAARSGGSGRGTMRDYIPAWWNGGVRDSEGARGSIDRISGEWTVMADTIGRGNAWTRGTNYYNYNMWDDPNDLRRSDANWVDLDEIVYNNPSSVDYLQPVDRTNFVDPTDSAQFNFAFPHYKTFIPHEDDVRPDGGFGNGYIYRLAGTYLLRAEAYYWLNDLPNAANDLNAVRNRAGAGNLLPGDVTIEKILEERAKELYTEEPRKAELTRVALIMADNNLNGYNISNVSTSNFYYDHVMDKNDFYRLGITIRGTTGIIEPYYIFWPIPAVSISSNSEGVINQNQGFPGAEQNVPPLTEITDNQ